MLTDYLRTLPQYLIPHHALSRLIYRLMRIRLPWLKNALMRWFVRRFEVDLSQAAHADVRDYPDFNSFFTRALKAGARPLSADASAIISPVDGTVSALGGIDNGTIVQAKGQRYSLLTLLAGDSALAATFAGGNFINIYLSPRDYHRIHMPIGGQLLSMHYVPGRLFSVSPAAVRTVPQLFTRNERLITVFASDIGRVAMIMVGALFVSGIDTVWQGAVTPRRPRQAQHWDYAGQPAIALERGAEAGRFNMGSTVILLFEPKRVGWLETLKAGDALRFGETIGRRQ